MQLSLHIKNESVSQKVLEFLSSFKKEDLQIETIDENENNSLSSFSGMWKDRDINIELIRESAWKK
jgi:hypothetical protein